MSCHQDKDGGTRRRSEINRGQCHLYTFTDLHDVPTRRNQNHY